MFVDHLFRPALLLGPVIALVAVAPPRPAAAQTPARGEILITEILAAPDGLPEWFEVHSLLDGAATRSLSGCTLERVRLDESGQPEGSVDVQILGPGTGILDLVAGSTLVFSEDGCADGPGGECPGGRLELDVSLTNSGHQQLRILCPDAQGNDVVVEEVRYDLTATGIRRGHSAQFHPGSASCQGESPENCNDHELCWCEAAFDDCYASNDDGDCNYGTPGVAAPCRTGLIGRPPAGSVDDGCPGTASASPPACVAGLLLGLAGPRWRRRR